MEENRNYNDEKRKARRKRRIMSQVFAYLFLVVVICVAGVGIFKVVKLIGRTVAKGNEVVVVSENDADEVVSDNEIGIIATPDSILEDIDEITGADEEVAVVEDVVSEEELEFINGLTAEQKAALLFITTPESVTGVNSAIQAGSGTRNALNTYRLGGLVYANRNVMDAAQYTTMLQTTQQMYSEIYGQDVLIMAVESDAIANLSSAGASGEAAAVVGDKDMTISFVGKDGSGLDTNADIVMLPNEDLASMDTDVPCAMSSLLINDSVRAAGFNGVVVTGFMDSDSVTGSFEAGEAAVLAINNGADMILRPADFEASYQAVVEAIQNGSIEEERLNLALAHIYRLKAN